MIVFVTIYLNFRKSYFEFFLVQNEAYLYLSFFGHILIYKTQRFRGDKYFYFFQISNFFGKIKKRFVPYRHEILSQNSSKLHSNLYFKYLSALVLPIPTLIISTLFLFA